MLKRPNLFRLLPSNSWRFLIISASSSSTSSLGNANPPDMARYREAFARKMAMAGLKPHHRIALGVSGGPDSIALCILALGWKKEAMIGMDENSRCISGIVGIVVDHKLRSESTEEANHVRNMVYRLGIRCEIVQCDWSEGRPRPGHLQEAARDMRYQLLQEFCIQHHIGVLLIAHHSDDQAELFVLRLSRCSGVLGLAGMAFTSQLFPACLRCFGNDYSNHGILLVRPLLEFSKEDMYNTAFTAAGCYLCASPGSKGTRILVSVCPDSPLPFRMGTSQTYSFQGQLCSLPSEIQQIVVEAKSYSDQKVPEISDVPFLHLTSSESILIEARKMDIICESTHENILLLRKEECRNFSAKRELKSENDYMHDDMRSANTVNAPLKCGRSCHFMNRFLVTWNICKNFERIPMATNSECHLEGENQDDMCRSCVISQDGEAVIRYMVDADWLYLSKLSKGQMREELFDQEISSLSHKVDQKAARTIPCSVHVQLSAQRALEVLKSIPASARRGLPVLVDHQGLLLSIPGICFKHCPYLSATAQFKPRVPLGGGYCSYI